MKISLKVILWTVLVVLGCCLTAQGTASAVEKPEYKVLQDEGKIELREYPTMLLAEVEVEGDRKAASNRGFRKLASFIFGENESVNKGSQKIAMTAPVVQSKKSEKIAMTSPVMQTPRSEGTIQSKAWTVNFMMPSEYSIETLPKPKDSDIRIYEMEPYLIASIEFSGGGSKEDLLKNEAKLRKWIAGQDLEIEGGPEYAFYDAPWVPKFMRRNEVHFRIATDP